ncbi:MAG TPA: hypothetical protein VK627_07940 [Edaphobacter sp.]|nr:hypothetical protein [Edaphobacter sp.]
MKKFLSIFLQFVLFLLVFAVGSFVHPFNLHWGLTVTTPTITHYFVADGLILMLAFYVVMLIVEALMKRLRTLAPWTTFALILAAVLGLVMKLGFITHEIY